MIGAYLFGSHRGAPQPRSVSSVLSSSYCVTSGTSPQDFAENRDASLWLQVNMDEVNTKTQG